MENYTYQIITTELGDSILRSDGAWIPQDERNVDYQAYLAWLDEAKTK